MGLGQALSIGVFSWSIVMVGLARFSGVTSALALVTEGEPLPEPEAQGPPLSPDGRMLVAGPFRYIRHPNNLPIISLFLLFPRMTVDRAVLTVLLSLYAVVGSLHQDGRPQAAYGTAFDQCRRATPLFWPRLKR